MKKRLLWAMLALLLVAAMTVPSMCGLADGEPASVTSTATEKSESSNPPSAGSSENQTDKPSTDSSGKSSSESSEKSSSESSEKPSSESSEKPSSESSEKPSSESSEKPSSESSEKPSEEPSEKPSEESSEEPSSEPSEKQSEEPTEGSSEEPKEEPSEEPSEELSEEPSEEPTQEPTKALHASLSDVPLYAKKGKGISFKVHVSGGVAPYTVSGGSTHTTLGSAGSAGISATATHYPATTVTVTVKDAAGSTVSLSARVPTPITNHRDQKGWLGKAKEAAEHLSGDWGKDILKIAQSQLGYHESGYDYVIRDGGSKQGYSIYGDYYGLPYEKWCAMFVAYCGECVGLSWKQFPSNAGCWKWVCVLIDRGVFMDGDDYEPQPGDLIFFNWHGRNDDADHIGIVESADGSQVRTIEGNSSSSVQRNTYDRDDFRIMGYGSTRMLMEAANGRSGTPASIEIPTEEPDSTLTEEPDSTLTEEPDSIPTEKPDSTPIEETESIPTEKPDSTPTTEPTATPIIEPTVTPTPKPTATPDPFDMPEAIDMSAVEDIPLCVLRTIEEAANEN